MSRDIRPFPLDRIEDGGDHIHIPGRWLSRSGNGPAADLTEGDDQVVVFEPSRDSFVRVRACRGTNRWFGRGCETTPSRDRGPRPGVDSQSAVADRDASALRSPNILQNADTSNRGVGEGERKAVPNEQIRSRLNVRCAHHTVGLLLDPAIRQLSGHVGQHGAGRGLEEHVVRSRRLPGLGVGIESAVLEVGDQVSRRDVPPGRATAQPRWRRPR